MYQEQYAANRGNGFMRQQFWQNEAIKMLMLIDAGTANIRKKMGWSDLRYGFWNDPEYTCGKYNTVWHGIHELTAGTNEHCSGLYINGSGKWFIGADAGATPVETNIQTSSTGDKVHWIIDINPEWAEKGAFIPQSTQSNISNLSGGLLESVFYYLYSGYTYVGETRSYSMHGLFSFRFAYGRGSNGEYRHQGTRLARVY